jgi:hypothetical protein
MEIHTINVPSTHRHVNSLIYGLDRFSPSSIEWLLDDTLFIHTQRVIQQQKNKEKVEENGDEEEDEEVIEVDEDDL